MNATMPLSKLDYNSPLKKPGKRRSKFNEIWRRYKKNKTAMIGLIVISLFVLGAIFADLIVPYENATHQVIRERMLPSSTKHIFGTDALGRDIFARVLHGSRYSLSISLVTTIAALIAGVIFGAMAGYYGGIIDNAIMRCLDVITSIPNLLLCMSIVSALGPNLFNLFLAMTISGLPGFVRIIRTSILNVVNQEYIEAARACGTNNFRIITKHVLANAIGPIIVAATMNVSQMILASATLSFLGLGFQPPTPEWGMMLSDAKEYMRTSFMMMVYPGLAIVISTLSINLIGDGLRDALDPKLKN